MAVCTLSDSKLFHLQGLAFAVTILLPTVIVPNEIPAKPKKGPYDPVVVAKYDLADSLLLKDQRKYVYVGLYG